MSALAVLAGTRQWAIEQGDVLERLAALPDESVNCVVTSPPYWGLRDYGTASWEGGDPGCDHKARAVPTKPTDPGRRYSTLNGTTETTMAQAQAKAVTPTCPKCGATRVDRQIGLEPTPETFVAKMVEVFREVRRVLRSDGTCWVNLGDSYSGGGGFAPDAPVNVARAEKGNHTDGVFGVRTRVRAREYKGRAPAPGLKPKDLVGMPWRVAFALQADGWWLRSDVVWAKPNPMPESVTDRPTRAHEYVFLLTKAARYAYDADAIREPQSQAFMERAERTWHPSARNGDAKPPADSARWRVDELVPHPAGRNKRTVWTIATEPYAEAHFATMPTALVEPCILAGCPGKTCPACGAPWARVVERVPRPAHVESDVRGTPRMMHKKKGQAYQDWLNANPDKTLGWEPTCDCGDCLESKDGRHRWQDGADFCERCGRDYENRYMEPVPGVVLDPFVGSGTVVLEALRHGRRGIGFDLSPDYCNLARTRVVGDAPLFNTDPEAAG